MSRLRMASLLTSNAIITGLGFAGGILVARCASVEDRGVFGEVLIWVTLLSGAFLTGHVDYYLSGRKPSRFPFLRRDVVLLCIVTFLALCAILAIDGLSRFLWYALLFVPLNFYSAVKIAQITLLGKVHVLSVYKLIQPVGYMVGLAVLWSLGDFSVEWLLAANLASNLILYAALVVGGTGRNELAEPVQVEWHRWRVISLAAVVGVLASQFDRVAASLLFSSSEVAHYLVGMTIIGAPLAVVGQATATLLLSKLVGDVDPNIETYAFLLSKLALVLIVVALLMTAVVPVVVELVLGDKYLPMVDISSAVALVGVVSNFRVVLVRLMKIIGRSVAVLYGEMAFVILVVSMTIVSRLLDVGLAEFLYLYAASGIFGLILLLVIDKIEARINGARL